MQIATKFSFVIFTLFFLSSCSYNPFIANNHTTGSPAGAALGAGIGAGSVGLLGGSKTMMVLAGLGGGAFGYYVTTLRADAGGIYEVGGKVYKVGDYVGIYIPTDQLFEPNTADFIPQAFPALDSTVAVLKRYPNNNILISGNTSGFSRSRYEQRLSQRRAAKVAAYLWDAGINNFKNPGTTMRKLNYVGYGDYFPIAHTYTNLSIRKNSRVQITSYPDNCTLKPDPFRNVGTLKDVPDNAPCSGRLIGGKCY